MAKSIKPVLNRLRTMRDVLDDTQLELNADECRRLLQHYEFLNKEYVKLEQNAKEELGLNCKRCEGVGEAEDDDDEWEIIICPDCDGSGYQTDALNKKLDRLNDALRRLNDVLDDKLLVIKGLKAERKERNDA